MSRYDVYFEIEPQYHEEGIHFINFLKNVAGKYPIKVHFKSINNGKFNLRIESALEGKIEAIFQELILNKGLYYYACSVSQKRNLITRKVIAPIYGEIIYNIFENPYDKFLIRHIKGIVPQNKYVPGDFNNDFSNEFQILFRRWDIKQISDWDFIVDLDALLNRFLLRAINHSPGQKSCNFNQLLQKAIKQGDILITSEMTTPFSTIHNARTLGLHRLQDTLDSTKLSKLGMEIYGYFDYLNDFIYSQQEKTEKLGGKKYKKIRYGYEIYLDEKGKAMSFTDKDGRAIDYKTNCMNLPCGDCDVKYGQMHVFGCDWEQCPKCRGQALSCGCKLDSDFDF